MCFGTHTFNSNCFLDDINYPNTLINWASEFLSKTLGHPEKQFVCCYPFVKKDIKIKKRV